MMQDTSAKHLYRLRVPDKDKTHLTIPRFGHGVLDSETIEVGDGGTCWIRVAKFRMPVVFQHRSASLKLRGVSQSARARTGGLISVIADHNSIWFPKPWHKLQGKT